MKRPLTAKEAAKELGYNVRHMHRLLKAGTVKGELVNGIWLIDPQEVERIRSQQGKGGRLPKGGPVFDSLGTHNRQSTMNQTGDGAG